MAINGVTSTLPDDKYIRELEKELDRVSRLVEKLQGVVLNQGRR